MYNLFITCTRYLEPILYNEIEQLGAAEIKQTVAGCRAVGDLETAYKLCLWSRTASRILLQLHEYDFSSEDDIYSGAAQVEWPHIFPVTADFAVDANVSRSRLKNANFAALRVKDALVDGFRKEHGKRPDVNTETPDIRFHLHTEKNKAILYIDLSGESLHKRGYRLSGGQAPLRETSAAGLLLLAGWPEIASHGGPFIDPMCGSGTLPIEAALIAGNIAPGLCRERFGFECWTHHNSDVWESILEEAKDTREKGYGSIPPIYASDKSQKAVTMAEENIKRAGLSEKIVVTAKPFEHITSSLPCSEPGLIATNPPYGVRLEKSESVNALYSELGKWMKEMFPDYTAAVLSPDKATAKQIGLRADKINTIYNGNLKIVGVRISLDKENTYVPPGKKSDHSKLPSMSEDETSGVNMLVNRLKKNRRKLNNYLKRNNISCYRIYDADIPQYAAAVDIYEGRYAVIQEYAPPKEIEKDVAEHRLTELISAVHMYLNIESQYIFLKQRKRQKGTKQYLKLGEEKDFYIVKEGGLKFFVNFTDYLDTGLFLDHRITREHIRQKADGVKFLNLFAYTCTASVYAAHGGAQKTVSVDTSTTYLDWGKKNFEINRLLTDSNLFIKRDVFSFLKSDFETYDLIFIDPPTFSNRKSDKNVFDVQRDHLRLITLAAEHLKKDGRIIFSNNFRRFKLDPALAELFHIEEISMETIPEDYKRNQKIHRTWILTFPESR